MGWSIDLIRQKIGAMLDKKDIAWTCELPDAMNPRAYVTTDVEIPSQAKQAIVQMFPDNVCVFFTVASIPDKPLEE